MQPQGLCSTLWSFVIPMTAAGLVWYIVFISSATLAPDLMVTPVSGNIDLSIILGLLQFVTTLAVTQAYINFTSKKLEPTQAELREALGSGEIAEIVAKKEAQTH